VPAGPARGPRGQGVALNRRRFGLAAGLALSLPAAAAQAQAPGGASAPAREPAADPRPLVRPVPLVFDRLRPADLGLVVNVRDPYSVAVGAYYAQQRGIRPQQVLRVELPTRPVLSPEEFEPLRRALDQHFDLRTQALALAWSAPHAVACNAITAAVTLGLDGALCARSCGPSRVSLYANSASARPYSDYRMRLSMLLAARSVDAACALIDRGVAADGSLAGAGAEPVDALFVRTAPGPRSVRSALYPPQRTLSRPAVRLRHVDAAEAAAAARAVLMSVGTVRLDALAGAGWVPGALADHLTSFGGNLKDAHDQSTVLDWIEAGVTATHGSVSEPCNHLHKFPQPQWLLGHYLQGSTAIEAYWKSVLWPQQSLFVGEPLAAPFARIDRP
jgi:uncharacterized protein (TIGR03790 family)